ncbi:MAG: glycoside hydrolase family 38 C-terminal domain-containing protein [Candidatus Hodarchaeota archaeon]
MNSEKKKKQIIIIVPHTHWDREWYLPFQEFRFKLVKLINELLDIYKKQDFRFMLDGQTIVLEDYLEIHPEKRDELVQRIREGKLAAGPWYLLPDEWLVGQESLIRNLEVSLDLSRELDIPLMPVGHLPDQFGHTRAIPQILSDLTSLKAAVVYRGVGSDVNSVPFTWKSDKSASNSILGIYLPGGYGNASMLPEEFDVFSDRVSELMKDLDPFSPVPVYLFMNGSDHLFPQPFLQEFTKKISNDKINVSLGFLSDFVDVVNEEVKKSGHELTEYAGEFRSSERAPLLPDTYSSRMWIKIWNQVVEDLLVNQAEPLCAYAWHHFKHPYPTGLLRTAWKWHLKNQPHDSICGCSVDQVHEEMKARYSWAETIAKTVVNDTLEQIQAAGTASESTSALVFDPTCASSIPKLVQIPLPEEINVKGLRTPDGKVHPVQPLKSKEDVLFEITVGLTTAKMGLKMLPGRKIMGYYINDFNARLGDNPEVIEVNVDVDTVPIGEIDIPLVKEKAKQILGDVLNFDYDYDSIKEGMDFVAAFKKVATAIINSKRFSKFHLVAAKPAQGIHVALVPLKPLAFTEIVPVEDEPVDNQTLAWVVDKNQVENAFYAIKFNKDGTITLLNKKNGTMFDRLHVFEDWGDRGDSYTHGHLGPEKVKVGKVKRNITMQGPVFADFKQECDLSIFNGLDPDRAKRVGKAKIHVESTFRFYRDLPRVDVKTKLTNTATDHRLRVCFDLPYKSKHTRTATHFGCIKRQGDPLDLKEYAEQPSGIQAQKRYCRVDEEPGKNAFTLMNKGLPEVELVNGNRLALTLIRAFGWLSTSGYPERDNPAGPDEETPGAQELGTSYEFNYAFMAHDSEDPIHACADHADSFAVETKVISLVTAKPPSNLLEPIIQIDNPWIRISSLRVRGEKLLVTLFNLESKDISAEIKLTKVLSRVTSVKIDGTVVEESKVSGDSVKLNFAPHEIKMCLLD